MSHASMSQRLDASRKEARELRQKLADTHTALPLIPPLLLSALAELAQELTSPTRHGDDLGVRVHDDRDEQVGPRRNPRAAGELRTVRTQLDREAKRVWTALERIGTGVMGDEAGASVGSIETVIYGKDRRWKQAGSSTNTHQRIAG